MFSFKKPWRFQALRTISKRARTNKKHAPSTTTTIKSLPHHLLLEVFSRVASGSCTDLFNVNLCCKDFLGAAKEDYIFQHVSIDKFPVVPWKSIEQQSSFVKRCKDNGNAEALYREGMIEYFSSKKQESGVENLKKAAEKGHIDASYVYGMMLLCEGGDQSKQEEGLKLLSSLKSRGLRIKQCRERIKAVLKNFWVTKNIVRKQDSCHAKTCNNKGRIQHFSGWTSSEENENREDVMRCDFCLWDHEVNLFCTMFTKT